MKIKAQAKVNLALDVVGILENEYHELDMIMAPVSLYNEIEIHPSQQDLITCDTMILPKNSTIHRTLQVLKEKKPDLSHYQIHVIKHIPDQAGLAGSSADAAAVFKAVCAMEGLSMELDEQLKLAARIGADVPFCMINRFARVKGIGEKIECITTDWKLPCLLVKPSFGISTPQAFQLWESGDQCSIDVSQIQKCIEQKDYNSLMRAMQNALETPAFMLQPSLKELKESMEKFVLDRVMMTGSGSCLMGFSFNQELLLQTQKYFSNQGYFSQIVTIG